MENHIFNFGLGYLVGLGVLGYVLLLYAIKKIGKKLGWPARGVTFIVALHFIAGLTAILFVPSIYFKNYGGRDSTVDGIIFSVTLLFILFIALRIAQHWDSLMEKD